MYGKEKIRQIIEGQEFQLKWFDEATLEYLTQIGFESERVLRGTINKLVFMMKYFKKNSIDINFTKDVLVGNKDDII